MKYFIVLFLLVFCIGVSSSIYATTALAENIPVPSAHCLSSNPCTTTGPTNAGVSPTGSSGSGGSQPTSAPSSAVTTTQTNPSSAPSTNPSPSSTPCSTSGASVASQSTGTVSAMSRHHHGKWHSSGNQGFLQQLIQWLWQFLQQLFQKLGIQLPGLPCGTTSSPSSTPSSAPSSGAGGGSGGSSPSGTPSSAPGNTTPTIFGTSPAPTSATSSPTSSAPSPTSSTSSMEPVGISGSWSLVFDDEFNGSSLNTTNWTTNIEQGDSTENNVQVSASNVSVSGGYLILTLSSSSLGANVSTDPSQGIKGFQFGDGYAVEGRIYFPGNGTDIYNWPAFWTVNNTWPQDGEIDIAEGNQTLTSNYHSSAGSITGDIPGTWSNGWHTYAVDREAGENYIYWDGKLVKSYATDDGGALHYITINVGASDGSDCNCGGTSVYGTASEVKVDYVRVWKKG